MERDVLIVGGGFGGAFCARRLEKVMGSAARRVTLVAPENFMLFSPLLPEAASGTLEPRHCVIPLRELLSDVDVMVGTVSDLDPVTRTARVTTIAGEEVEIRYRHAVIAPGSVPTIAPVPGLLDHAVGFKTLADAIWLRNQVLHQLDAADATSDHDLRRELLTFTFVGGGYAGVEALAELESLARDAVRAYPDIRPDDFRWVLVEAADSLLPGLDDRLAEFSLRTLRRRGVEVYLGTRMESCEGGVVRLDDGTVEPYRSRTIVWTAGQRPNPAPGEWGLPLDDAKRIPVDRTMAVTGLADHWAIGDVAAVPAPDGGEAPNTAQHALRQARVAAENVAAALGFGSSTVYDYRDRGLAVTLGKWQGTAQVKGLTFTGPLAWWMGRSYHLIMMPGLGRKARVVADWTIALFFRRDVSQLGQLGSPARLDS